MKDEDARRDEISACDRTIGEVAARTFVASSNQDTWKPKNLEAAGQPFSRVMSFLLNRFGEVEAGAW